MGSSSQLAQPCRLPVTREIISPVSARALLSGIACSSLAVGGLTAGECDRDMPHRRIGLGAMPIAFTNITNIDLVLFMFGCDHAGARGHDQHLVTVMVCHPVVQPWLKLDAAVMVGGVSGLNDGLRDRETDPVYPTATRLFHHYQQPPVGRAFARTSRSASPTSTSKPRASKTSPPSARRSGSGAAWYQSTAFTNGRKPRRASSPMRLRSIQARRLPRSSSRWFSRHCRGGFRKRPAATAANRPICLLQRAAGP
jgi:hypothetical protein